MIRNLSPLRRFRQGSSYSSFCVLVRVQRFSNDMYKAVKVSSTRPLVPLMIAGSYWPRVISMITGTNFRRHRRLTICEPDKTKFVSPFILDRRLDERRRPNESFASFLAFRLSPLSPYKWNIRGNRCIERVIIWKKYDSGSTRVQGNKYKSWLALKLNLVG